MSKPKILLLNGISGSGKSTIGKYLQTLGVFELISHTTRQIRQDEIPNESYYYITKEEFDKLDKLEQTCYSGNYYCLSQQEVERHNENLVYCIVDSHGVEQIKNAYGKDVVAVYLDVTYDQMKERMKLRGDSKEDIQKRIDYAINTNEKERDIEVSDYYIPSISLERVKSVMYFLVNKLKKEGEI